MEGDVGRQVGVRGVDSTREERWIGMRCRYMGWGDWRRLGQEEGQNEVDGDVEIRA